ncbi:hypothetical protein ECANGB1_1370 [Enterospora canceri]|uniref:Transposase Helix-turn-helix domain-containing protein n=1 Tax=Enterospora canceri TaxID=1081671 RepID=A0A1Y1S689_9MICR|nr:hypothetical protein ECANGB1_1370 [Enterospora canceri]
MKHSLMKTLGRQRSVVGNFSVLNETVKVKELKCKLALFIWFIAHQTSYRAIREVFGLPKSTVHEYIREMYTVLSGWVAEMVKFPSEAEYNVLADGFSAPQQNQ